jgi:endoglucanase
VGSNASRFDGYVRVAGREIVDGAGNPLLLRGVGLGNWLLPEGYMWRFPDQAASPRLIEARIEELVGPERAAGFWAQFREHFIDEADIALIAELGFDHVRLPINSRVVLDDDGELIESGFALIDRLIAWCGAHQLWVLLDLHGAPGGQTGTNIDDSPHGDPELFLRPQLYRPRTVALWEAIARRYRDEPIVLGYDLLNEPLPHQWQHTFAAELRDLYQELTAAIRAIDTNHLIMYEGSHWATNWSIFTEVWDANSVLQFHRYWCPPERDSIAEYLAARDRLGLPIYMGEGGENNPEWIYTATRLYEEHGIGWNFWPWKKLDTRTSPLSIPAAPGWTALATPGQPVEPGEAWRILTDYLRDMRVARCERRDDVVNALFARPPLTIPAWGFTAAKDANGPDGQDFRSGDGVVIRPRVTVGHQRNWQQTDGRDYATQERLDVLADAGHPLCYPLADPAGYQVQVLDSNGAPVPATVDWSDGVLTVATREPAALGSVVVVAGQD